MYSIGTEVCLESSDDAVTIVCQLANEPTPAPKFEMAVTSVTDNSTENLEAISGNSTQEMFVNSSTLSLIFESDSVINIKCTVSNSLGSDNETTLVRACGRCCRLIHNLSLIHI